MNILVTGATGYIGTRLTDFSTGSQSAFQHPDVKFIGINVTGPYQMSRAATPHLKASGDAAIVNISSVGGWRAGGSSMAYCASKGGVMQLTKAASLALAKHNIRVNAISPGAVATPIFWGGSQRAQTLSDEENQRKMEKLEANLAKATPLPGLTASTTFHVATFIDSAVNPSDRARSA